MTKTLARWESKRGKHWVTVVQYDDGSYGFRSNGSGGSGYLTLTDATKRAELEYTFQPAKMYFVAASTEGI